MSDVPPVPKGEAVAHRQFMAYFTRTGLAATLFPGALWSARATAQEIEITDAMIASAERIAGLEFTEAERKEIRVNNAVRDYETIRDLPIDNAVPPAFEFNPLVPGTVIDPGDGLIRMSEGPVPALPERFEDLAFWSLTDLSRLVRAHRVTSEDLTRMYLERLKQHDPALECVVTLTEDRALEQARERDRELTLGRYRGPLHGIPWGAKDLLAVKGYRTTWGAMPYVDQTFEYDATVVERLDGAGAVLVAKLTLGALAQGDVWFGGRTNNPWNVKRGSSGSSAGPGAATAAGLVGFSIGSETNGSIASPSTVCGVTGLRPTFGRVSRHGAMALSWTMDKLGPMCRSVEDCALVLAAIYGPDGHDATVKDIVFTWNPETPIEGLRVGVPEGVFRKGDDDRYNHQQALEDLRTLGLELVPIALPDFPVNALSFILTTESAAAFDDLTRSTRDDLLVRQGGWPRTFRQARMVPAVEYIQANRARTLLMREMAELMNDVDLIVQPGTTNLLLGNLTGHPLVCLPSGFAEGGTPTSIAFLGRLYDEGRMLAVAKAYQDATGHHRKHPVLIQNWADIL